MIFRRELLGPVLRGTKTVTVIRPGDYPYTFLVGRSYSVQRRRNGPALGRIEITGRTEHLVRHLPDLDLDPVELEGIDPDEQVQVVRFKLEGDRGRFLAHSGRGDYTSQPAMAMRGEGQAVDRDVQDRMSMEGTQATVARLADQAAKHEARSLSARLQELERAHRSGEDVGIQLAAVRRAIERAERKMGRKAA